MAIINLKRYYPNYPKDKFLDVSDEVADALEEGRLIENRQDHKRKYYHVWAVYLQTRCVAMVTGLHLFSLQKEHPE
jgi:hypothetical protein